MIRSLGRAEALAAIAAVREELERRRDAAVVAVGDAQGETLALLRMDGAPVFATAVAVNKAWTAARLRRPSRAVGEAIRDRSRGVDAAFYGDPRIVGWAGGEPVTLDGEVVGAVGVSGMSQALDEELALLGVAAILRAPG